MVILGVYLILNGGLSVGALVASAMLSMRVLAPISSIAAVVSRATQTIIAFKALNRVMSLERERPPARSYVTRRIESGSIAFENATFRYPAGAVNAIENVSFRVSPGERIGIIGRVGSGKTTVGRLLAGFYEPDDGRILVDGIDIRQYDPADLRSGVGFVLQDTDLFFGKLRDNIALGKPEATDEEIIAAARLAGVESFIAGHPLGYEMPIAEGGRSLSGGQKQAIGLARALIRNPRILFLDEPTAHFDMRSETEFLHRLKALAEKDLTILISTHRLSLLSFVERILLFEQGKLVADGPRDKIISMLRGGSANKSGGPAVVQPAAEIKTRASV
jgi:ATP-binding cassette subfamily C protein LapB